MKDDKKLNKNVNHLSSGEIQNINMYRKNPQWDQIQFFYELLLFYFLLITIQFKQQLCITFFQIPIWCTTGIYTEMKPLTVILVIKFNVINSTYTF